MTTVTIGQRGTITLPKKLREQFGWDEGAAISVHEEDGALVLKPYAKKTDPVLISIREALEDIKRGDYIEFSNLEEFDRELEKYNKRHDARKISG